MLNERWRLFVCREREGRKRSVCYNDMREGCEVNVDVDVDVDGDDQVIDGVERESVLEQVR